MFLAKFYEIEIDEFGFIKIFYLMVIDGNGSWGS
jgi:hypothetical protein